MDILRKLRTRRFAVAFMILMAASLILATAIPQRTAMNGVELYRFHADHPGLSSFISAAGLDHVYTTWWFLGAVFLFALNISLNLSEQVKSALRKSRHEAFPGLERIEKLPLARTLPVPGNADADIERRVKDALEGKGYRTEGHSNGFIASKGVWSAWSIPVFHLGMLIILAGILISGLTKFNGSSELSEGQTFSGKGGEFIEKVFGALKLEPALDFQLRLKKYRTENWDNGRPKLYRSTMEVVEHGKPVFSKDVEMNEPLRYKGYAFYQSKYHGYSASLALRDKDTGAEVSGYVNFPYMEHPAEIIAKDFNIPQTQYRATVRFDAAYPDIIVMKVLDNSAPVWEGIVPKEGSINLGNKQLVFHGMVQWTGIYAARDWGVPVVYTGFAVLVLSIFGIVFVVPKTFYVCYDGHRMLVGAKALRGRELFREEFDDVVGKIERICREHGDSAVLDRDNVLWPGEHTGDHRACV
ncbi:MAG TPA: cytochrome c biogenesis protein ResB [Dissulfurispiraceae bacterium]